MLQFTFSFHRSYKRVYVWSMKFGNSHCSNVEAPTHLSYLTMSISAVLALLTISGNMLVLIVLVRNRNNRPCREKRTPLTLLLANLAVTDVIAGGITLPFSLFNHYQEALKQPKYLKVPLQFFFFYLSIVSVSCLAAITLDRYFAVSRPFWHRVNATPKRVIAISVVIWLFSSVLVSSYFEVGFIIFSFVFCNTSVTFTIFIFFFTYGRSLKKLNMSMFVADRATGQHVGSSSRTMSQIVVRREKKLTKAFLLMLLLFLSCYFPAAVFIYLMNFCFTCSCVTIHWFRDLQFWFVMASSAMNPFVYAFRFPSIRRSVTELLTITGRRNRIAPTVGSTTRGRLQVAWSTTQDHIQEHY